MPAMLAMVSYVSTMLLELLPLLPTSLMTFPELNLSFDCAVVSLPCLLHYIFDC
jgi:hypothetical protein